MLQTFMARKRKDNPRSSAVTLTPNQVVALKLEEARAAKRWTQMETVQRLRRSGLRWSRAAYAMAVGSPKGKRPARFDADQLIAFAQTFGTPAWWFLVPPVDWSGKPVKVRLSKKSGGGTLDDGAMYDLAVGSALPPEPRNEEERRRQERENERIIEQVMQFAYSRKLLPRPEPLPDYPPEVEADLEKAADRVLRKHKLAIKEAQASPPSRGQLGALAKILEVRKENQ